MERSGVSSAPILFAAFLMLAISFQSEAAWNPTERRYVRLQESSRSIGLDRTSHAGQSCAYPHPMEAGIPSGGARAAHVTSGKE